MIFRPEVRIILGSKMHFVDCSNIPSSIFINHGVAKVDMSEKPEQDPEPPIDRPDPTDPVKVAELRI